MKTKSLIATVLLFLLLGTVKNIFAQIGNEPAPSVVEGDNLSIGSGNSLEPSGLLYVGNAIGLQNVVQSPNALAVGSNDTIGTLSASSVALGAANKVVGVSSMGFGVAVKVNGTYGVGIGHHIRVNGVSGGMVIGSGIVGTGTGNDSYLVNGHSNSLAIGFNSTKPTLFVSESPNTQNSLDKTGKVAIGDVTPQAKLHIRSDAGEDAGIILAPASPAVNRSFIRFRDNYHYITVDSTGGMLVSAGSSNRLGLTSSNFNVWDGTALLGTSQDSRLCLSADSIPCLTSNAIPMPGGYSRSFHGPSYALEFGDKGLVLRAATYSEPRYNPITNWATPVEIGTNGDITLNGDMTFNGASFFKGKVGINTKNATNDYALAVDGGMITTKVHIQDVSDWQDRVFDGDYSLMPLDELEAYVAANRHLPGIPSEAEVKADGFDMAGMASALLGKVEELTLYAIGQQREIDSLRELVTVRFGYDACGNRVSRTLEFQRMDGDRGLASLTDTFAGADMALFPNPTEGGFMLSFSGDSLPDNGVATLCSVDGTVLEQRNVNRATEEFDLSGRPAGIYLLHLSSEGTVQTWKIVKR